MTSPEEQRLRALESFNPAIMSLYQDSELQKLYPFYKDFLEIFQKSAVSRPSVIAGKAYNKVSNLYFNAVHQVLRGDLDAQTAMEYLELDIQDALAAQ